MWGSNFIKGVVDITSLVSANRFKRNYNDSANRISVGAFLLRIRQAVSDGPKCKARMPFLPICFKGCYRNMPRQSL